MTRAFIGLGSNLGDRVGNIRKAIERLGSSKDVEVLQRASLYETEPVGVEDQPWFINTVVEIETKLAPYELFKLCRKIETQGGRRHKGRWGPREIDLDLLLFGDVIMDRDELKIPHPQLHQRRFVLVPLCEIEGSLRHPILKKTVKELLTQLKDAKAVKRYDERDFDRGTRRG